MDMTTVVAIWMTGAPTGTEGSAPFCMERIVHWFWLSAVLGAVSTGHHLYRSWLSAVLWPEASQEVPEPLETPLMVSITGTRFVDLELMTIVTVLIHQELAPDETYVSTMVLLIRNESMGETAATAVVTSVLLSLLTGVCIVLSVRYFQAYPNDPLMWRGLVFLLLLHVIAIFALAAGSTSYVIHSPSVAASFWLSSRISAGALFAVANIQHLTQLFFSYRAYLLSGRRRIILACCATMSIATYGASLANCVVAFELPKITRQTTKAQFDAGLGAELVGHFVRAFPFGIVWMVMTLATDVAITCTLLYFLVQTKSAFSNTQSAIKKLMLTITEAMLPPFLCAVLTAGLVLGGHANLGLVLFPLGANFYHIAVTSHLLARGKVRSILEGTSRPHWPAGTKPAVTNLGSFPERNNVLQVGSQHGENRDMITPDERSEEYKGFDNGSQPTLGPIVAELDHDGVMRMPRNVRTST